MLSLLTFAAIVFLFDQITKGLVQTCLSGPVGGRLLQIRRVHHRKHIYHHNAFRAAMAAIWAVSATAAVCLYDSGLYLQSHVGQAGVGGCVGRFGLKQSARYYSPPRM